MLRSSLCIAVFFVATRVVAQSTWASTYPEEYQQALKFFKVHRASIDSAAQRAGVSSQFFFSIVAPEVGHFQVYRDKIETSVVTLFYVEMGSDHGNFSIGPFQMQPEFVEHLEGSASDEKSGRVSRVERIKTLKGSLEYLVLFLKIASANIKADTPENKLALMASAYNYGYWRDPEEIRKHAAVHSFPRGASLQLSYAAMATEFYRSVIP